MKKIKLDQLLVERGFYNSVDLAKRIIMAGDILIDDIVITQPGTLCDPKSRIRIKTKKTDYVSRGGDKLAQFLKNNPIEIKNKCCLDIGISTGGFTDVLFRNDALHVLGIDVGYGILDFKLRKNKKLSLLERTNAREVSEIEINNCLGEHHFGCKDIQLVVMDVSFISVFKIIPNLIKLLRSTTEYLILIKPQFEGKKEWVDYGGIVTNPDYITKILNEVEQNFDKLNFEIIHSEPSNIKGTKGNQEFFYYVKPKA